MTADWVLRIYDTVRRSRIARSRHPLWQSVTPSIQRVLARTLFRNGVWVEFNREPYLVDYMYRHLDGYMEAAYDTFLRAVKPGMTVFDIGAHLGVYSLGAARRLGRRGT